MRPKSGVFSGMGMDDFRMRSGDGLAAGEDALPQGKNDERVTELRFGGFADLPDALFRDAQLDGDVVERGLLQVVGAEHAGVIRRELIEREVQRRVGISSLGGARRARRIAVDQRVELLAVGVGLVDRACMGGGRKLFELRDGGGRQTGQRGDLAGGRCATELALKRLGRPTDQRDLRAGVPRERVEPAKFVEDTLVVRVTLLLSK